MQNVAYSLSTMPAAGAPDVLVDLTRLDTNSRYTGTGRYIHELGVGLAALSDRERRGLTLDGLVALGGDAPLGPLTWTGSPDVPWPPDREAAWLTARRVRLPRTLRRIRPRLFHATYSRGTPRLAGVPRVVTCLDLVPLVLHEQYLPRRPFYRRALFAVEMLRFHSARRVLAISQHTADELVQLLRVPASKIDVTNLGVDGARYHVFDARDARIEAAKRKYGLTQPYVFYIGAADPRKNVDVLVAAFAQARVDGLELAIVGRRRPSDERAFARAMAAAGHPRGVRFVGFVPEDDLPAVVAGGVAFVGCSTHEGFPYVHLEAMACGVPVITAAVTSMRDIVADAALVVPPRDVAATANAIRRVVCEPALGRDLAAAGVRCAARFTLRDTALATIDAYVKALA
jgi:glycosyltransferase involved in cell wall biosynthesis